jgi:hypothetical protein
MPDDRAGIDRELHGKIPVEAFNKPRNYHAYNDRLPALTFLFWYFDCILL